MNDPSLARPAPVTQSRLVNRAIAVSRFHPAPGHRAPAAGAVAGAAVVAVGLCLAIDWLLVRAGTAAFPGVRDYVHFRFSDYSKLTVIGIVIASAAWPVVARLTSQPSWVLARLAVLVTAVLLLPDLYIWLTGQPGRAVLVLVAMHLAIGLVTCTALVRLAPVRLARDAAVT